MVIKKNELIKSTRSSGNVFADLKIPDPEQYLEKAKLAFQINSIIKKKRLKQNETAKILGIDQSKVLALSQGLLDDFSIEWFLAAVSQIGKNEAL